MRPTFARIHQRNQSRNRKTRNILTSGNFSLTADAKIQTPLKPRAAHKQKIISHRSKPISIAKSERRPRCTTTSAKESWSFRKTGI